MRVIVVGAGEVGFDVARMLEREQHDVTVIDLDPHALENVRDKLDVMTLQGNGTSAMLLQEAGIKEADMMIAVTTVDEVNIIACMMADRLGVETTVARVRSSELTHNEAVLKTSDFGIDLAIRPEESAAAEIHRLIRRASATDVLTFADGRLQLVGMRLDHQCHLIGRSLQEIAMAFPDHTFRIMAIVRGIRTILPRGHDVLQYNDQVFVLARPKDMPHVARLMGKQDARMHHIMILGGSQVGAKVAMQLAQVKHNNVKLVEPDRERAKELADQIPNVLVIHGDATDIDLLVLEGLGEMDAFVAVTHEEESNLVTCLMAKHLGVRKTVALLSKGAYIPISQAIGLDAAVSTKLAVSREIMRFLRGNHVLSVATVHGMDAEILEIEVEARAPATRGPLRDLSLPKGTLIGAVMHGRTVEVATGQTEIHPGDRVILFALPRCIEAAERYFDRA